MIKTLQSSLKTIAATLYSPKYLLVTNCATGVLSMAVGDSVQQLVEFKLDQLEHSQHSEHSAKQKKEFEFNQKRNLSMMSAGIYFGLFGHIWYSFLDKRFPGKHKSAVTKKLMAEMAMGPPLVSGVFLIISKLKGMDFDKSWSDLKSNFGLICSVEWLVYIPLQCINFSLLGPKFRYLYVATISIGYDAFLSYVIHKNERKRQSIHAMALN